MKKLQNIENSNATIDSLNDEDEFKEKTEKICCNDKMFSVLNRETTFLIDKLEKYEYLENLFKKYGISIKMLKLLNKSFDKEFIEKGERNFRNSLFIFKLRDENIEPIAAKYIRSFACNIISISEYVSNVLLRIGTPEDMSDIVKCGFFSGHTSLFVYYFGIIYIFMNKFNPQVGSGKEWVNIVLSILIFLGCIIIKMWIFPLLIYHWYYNYIFLAISFILLEAQYNVLSLQVGPDS